MYVRRLGTTTQLNCDGEVVGSWLWVTRTHIHTQSGSFHWIAPHNIKWISTGKHKWWWPDSSSRVKNDHKSQMKWSSISPGCEGPRILKASHRVDMWPSGLGCQSVWFSVGIQWLIKTGALFYCETQMKWNTSSLLVTFIKELTKSPGRRRMAVPPPTHYLIFLPFLPPPPPHGCCCSGISSTFSTRKLCTMLYKKENRKGEFRKLKFPSSSRWN